MSDPLYIEFRLRGFIRHYALWVKMRINQQAKKLKLKNTLKKGHVSHITLFGPARTNHFPQVMNDIEKVCNNYTLVPFRLGGFNGFYNKDANYLYFTIQPSHDLAELRLALSKKLIQSHNHIARTCTPFDKSFNFKFHSTIGKYPSTEKDKFDKLLEFVKTNCRIEDYNNYKRSILLRLLTTVWKLLCSDKKSNGMVLLHLLRLTILGRRSHIRYEYDLMLKKLLSRREALSRYWSKRTIDRFRNLKAVS